MRGRFAHLRSGALAVALALGSPARADWEVRRAPDDPRVTDALLAALLRAPDDRAALARLKAHAAGHPALLRLAERCDARAQERERLACGHLYRDGGRPELALERYAALGADARAERAAGELLLRLGRADEALRALDKARSIEKDPAVLEVLLAACAQARTPSAEERRRLAESVAEELLALRPGDLALHRRTADALATVEAHGAAARVVAGLAARAHDPRTRAPLLFRSAELLESDGQVEAALGALEQALALLPARDARRREAQERIVAIERKSERLPELATRWSAWPEGQRDAGTEELLGRVLDELGDGAAAQRHLERALRLDPRAVGPRRLLIRLHSRAGDEDAAIAELRRLAAIAGPSDPRIALELAERLFARPGGKKEATELAAAVGRRQRDSATHAALAALYQKWGDAPRALAEANLLVRLEPDDPEHLIALGELHDQRGDKAAALRTWRRLATGGDPPLAARLRLADVLAEHDAAGEALALLERAAQEHPTDPTIQRRLADVLDRLRRDAEAEAIYRRLIEEATLRDDATVVRDSGGRWLELAARRGNLSAALAPLAALAESPTSAARVELAFVVARGRAREQRGTEAERLLRKLGEAAPRPADRARALEALAELFAQRGGPRRADALELLVRAAELDGSRAPSLYGKASQRAAELYRDDEALRYAERAVTLAPLDADAQEHLGTLLEPRDPKRALAAYDRALELDVGRDRLRLRAAELALRGGDDEGAAARYRAVLARARDEQALDEAARRAVVVHELTGRLGALEREIAPRATVGDGPAVLRRLLVDVERRYVPQLAIRADAGDAEARAELQRIATHALTPLLDAVLDGDRDERRAAVVLLGQLGARGAAPLLLRLAAGDAARRGAEAPPIELRAAAADAAAWFVEAEHLPSVQRLAADAEQHVRAAATVALARLATARSGRVPGTAERARTALFALVNDDHDRIAATACVGLAAAGPGDLPWPAIPAIIDAALDAGGPLAARACGIALARHLEAGEAPPTPRQSPRALLLRAANASPPASLTAGLARALLATGDSAAQDRALRAVVDDVGLRRQLVGSTGPSGLRRGAGGVLDLDATLATLEGLPAAPARAASGAREAVLRLFEGPTAEPLLAALLAEGPTRAVLPRLVMGGEDAAARAELLDAALPQLERIAQGPTDGAGRALALSLLAERPRGLPAIVGALQRSGDHRAALSALAQPTATELGEADLAPLVQVLRPALTASDWRERRAGLACLKRHPLLAGRLGEVIASLRGDPNALVAEEARATTSTRDTTPLRPPGPTHVPTD